MTGRTVANFWRDVEAAIREGKEAAVRESGKHVHRVLLDELRKGSPGRGLAYPRGKKFHYASRPGSPPARDTGNLIRSAGMEFEGGPKPRAVVGIKRSAPYAKYLDPPEGEKEPKIGRRPFLSTAWRISQADVREIIRRELDGALRRRT